VDGTNSGFQDCVQLWVLVLLVNKHTVFASMGMQENYGADFLVYFCYPFMKRID
jgi:hypothetical protein